MSETFLYSVHPKKVITGLSGCSRGIRTKQSLLLTKEDVYLCLKNATVYRRFANENNFIERVTIDNVERVHREKYISEEDWAKFLAEEKAKGNKQVVDTTPVKEPEKDPENETPVTPVIPTEESKKETEETTSEEPKNETPVSEIPTEEPKKETEEEVLSDDEEVVVKAE